VGGGGVGNSGVSALGLRSGELRRVGTAPGGYAVFRWQNCRKFSVNSALPRKSACTPGENHAGHTR
jgi:hypothetical protein